MKKLLRLLVVSIPLMALLGCEFNDTEEDEDKYKFLNKSTHVISVSPVAQSGWGGFSFGPGEKVVLNNVDDLYFTFEPRFRVAVGDDTDGRIVFINQNENTVDANQD